MNKYMKSFFDLESFTLCVIQVTLWGGGEYIFWIIERLFYHTLSQEMVEYCGGMKGDKIEIEYCKVMGVTNLSYVITPILVS